MKGVVIAMGTPSKVSPIRHLVPKSYHFDGYDELNCPNARDKPFFSDNVVPMGEYTLTTRLVDEQTLEVLFSSICPEGRITFQPLRITLEEYIQKLKDAISDKRDFIYLEIFPTYYNVFSCKSLEHQCEKPACVKLRKDHPQHIFAAVSFHMAEVQQALSIYHGITNNKEVTAMKNGKKFLGMNFEFGVSRDPNIASTMMGVAVRNRSTGNWITYDPVNRKRTDMASMKLGNLPIFLLPVQALNAGDLIKLDGRYYYVESVQPGNNREVRLLSPEDGTIHDHLLSDLIIPGLNFYTKVVAMDLSSMTDASSKQNVSNNILAAIFMMQWSKGKNAESFASLDDVDDDSFNGLGKYLPMLMAMSGGNGLPSFFQSPDGKPNMMAILALGGDDSDDDDDMMKLMIISQMFNGNTNIFGGASGAVTSGSTSEEDQVLCEACGKTYPAGTVFCPQCGSKTVKKVSSCPHCGAELMPGAAFCHKCGKKVTPDACPKCGNTLTGDELFCPKCGTPVKGESVTPVTAPSKDPAVEHVSEES